MWLQESDTINQLQTCSNDTMSEYSSGSNSSSGGFEEVMFNHETEEALGGVGLGSSNPSFPLSQPVQPFNQGDSQQLIAAAEQQYQTEMQEQNVAILDMVAALSSTNSTNAPTDQSAGSKIPQNISLPIQSNPNSLLHIQPSQNPLANSHVDDSITALQTNNVAAQQQLLTSQMFQAAQQQRSDMMPPSDQESPSGFQLSQGTSFTPPLPMLSNQPPILQNQQLEQQRQQLQVLQQLLLSANTMVNQQSSGTMGSLTEAFPTIPQGMLPNNLTPQMVLPTTLNSLTPVSSFWGQGEGGQTQPTQVLPATTSSSSPRIRPARLVKPKRPLSAYNIFFKEERARILRSIPDKRKREKVDETGEDIFYRTSSSQAPQDILDPTGPLGTSATSRSLRKKSPHGKMSFENLAREVGQRWKNLDEGKLQYYKKLAAADSKRYKEQMDEFLNDQRAESERKMKKYFGSYYQS